MDETKQPQNEMPNEPQNERPSEPQNEKGAGAYIGTGMVFGLVIGAGMGDLSQGMLIGMALGAVAAAFQGKFGKRMK
ncbi:MAG: hypothetical protein E7I13_04265 [Negativicoccus succinicivorans]|uniref:hypothetical protein n=1 Tax=Negativicoccus succinicivorans TaxID=620903 RepID=UPI0005103F7E|nr:hypothetical protein [Negativicoccus succinicivorans]KGF11740.1 hypothetical protein HMPREF1633_04200 [Tissierellia bacterium S5-A11]MDU1056206.1 hypothetical protein [Negativicoccus succinicivorans]MDU4202933.1 hypothetical protein [Negativicoccus succinicivorans]MDU5395552.1 hypothetical protein [Negativicoccus succinicivorans]